jgi:hypothetical protein
MGKFGGEEGGMYHCCGVEMFDFVGLWVVLRAVQFFWWFGCAS